MPKLSRDKKHPAVYTNSKGLEKDVYLQYEEKKDGFVVRDAETDKPVLRESYVSLAELRNAGVKIRLMTPVEPSHDLVGAAN